MCNKPMFPVMSNAKTKGLLDFVPGLLLVPEELSGQALHGEAGTESGKPSSDSALKLVPQPWRRCVNAGETSINMKVSQGSITSCSTHRIRCLHSLLTHVCRNNGTEIPICPSDLLK